MKKFNKFLNEIAVTTPYPGSGTKVGGGAEGSFTKASGQSVYGGDSSSSFASSSNTMKVKDIDKRPIPNPDSDELTKDDENKYSPKSIINRNAKKRKKRHIENIEKTDIIDKNTEKEKRIITKWELFKESDAGGAAGGSTGSGDSGGGTSYSTLGNTSGMGAIQSPQTSGIPGDVSGSIAGSGDISQTQLGPFLKQTAGEKKKKKKKKKHSKVNDKIDQFYVTKYSENYTNGNIITDWKAFTERKIFESKELNIIEGKLYGVELEDKGNFNQDLVDIYVGKNENKLYEIGQIRILGDLIIFYPDFRNIQDKSLILTDIKQLNNIRKLDDNEIDIVIKQLKEDKHNKKLMDDSISYFEIIQEIVGKIKK